MYPNTQATRSPVFYQPSKWMDLIGAHKEDFTVATSGSRCWTMCMHICHLLSYSINVFLMSTPPIPCLSSADCSTFSWYLITTQHQNKDFCVHSSHFLGYILNCHKSTVLFKIFIESKSTYNFSIDTDSLIIAIRIFQL